jgi:hypothetical protein
MLRHTKCHTFVPQREVSAEIIQAGYGPTWMHVVMRADSTLQCVLMQWLCHLVESLLMYLLQVTCLYIGHWLAGNVQCTLSPKEQYIVIVRMGYSLYNS